MATVPASPALLILKILTPASIAKMTTLVNREDRVSLTNILVNEDEEKKFKRELISNDGTKQEGKNESEAIRGHEEISKEIISGEKIEVVEDNTLSMSVFLLKQKERLKNSQQKLKKREILSLYESSAAINIGQEELSDENLSGSFQCGTLLDKKQF